MKIDKSVVDAEASALKELFYSYIDRKKDEGLKITQTSFGQKQGWTQAAVNNYLNGKNTLNTNAALIFANELECEVVDFSPRLAELLRKQAEASNNIANEVLSFWKMPIYNQENIEILIKDEGKMASSSEFEVVSGDVSQDVFGVRVPDFSMGTDSKNSVFVIDRNRQAEPTNTVLVRVAPNNFAIRNLKVSSFDQDLKPIEWVAYPTNNDYPSFSNETSTIIGVAIRQIKTLIP